MTDSRTCTRRPITTRRLALSIAVAAGALIVAAPALGDPVTKLAERLASLRGEVESLSAELTERENQLRDRMRSYARQKSELKLEVQREETRLKKTRLAIAQKKELIEKEQAQSEGIQPVFDRASGKIRKYVQASLPFRRSERLAALDKIEDQTEAGLLTPQRAISRLWTFIEDELRLTRESGMYRQTIHLDGEDQLADVIRVGMVMLYFESADGQVGYADETGGGWEYKAFQDEQRKKLVLHLFDSMRKQIRVGFFELPNALPEEQIQGAGKEAK